MKIKTKILIVLTALWMLLIFLMSAQSVEASSEVSNSVTAAIVETIYGDEKPQTFEDLGWKGANENIAEMLDKGLVPKDNILGRNKFVFKSDVRKLAHIVLYFVLAVLVNTSFVSHFGKNRPLIVVISFGVCVVYAALDEIHQFFANRGAQLRDVYIDCIGILFGLVFVAGVCAVIKLIKIIASKSKKTA